MRTPITAGSMEAEAVGRKLRELRKSRNLTQTKLAARIGIQQSDLCRMENGRYRVNLDTLVRILAELQVPFSEFFEEGSVSELTPPEIALVRSFRALPLERQEEIVRYVQFMRSGAMPRHGRTEN